MDKPKWTEKIGELEERMRECRRIVFFGGAGVSTESKIPDFRSANGLYQQKHFPYPPEVMLSHSFFLQPTREFFDFYRTMIFKEAKPNDAHLKLAQWEKEGKVTAVVTQNIDGLHQEAGSENVYELHGSVKRNHCQRCDEFYSEDYILAAKDIPRCKKCHGIIKPDVVLYEESLNMDTLHKAKEAIGEADMLIVGGTSLVVYPAAGMVNYYHGDHLVLVNRDETAFDNQANLVLHGSIGEIFRQLP